MLTFTQKDIHDNTQSNYYFSGINYYQSNKVTYCTEVDRNSFAITLNSQVKGNQRRLYHQNIFISNDFGDIDIEGQCDCLIGYNCKHVAAVCLHYLKQLKNKMPHESSAELWLKKFTQPHLDHIDTSDKEFLIYTFDFDKESPSVLFITLSRHKFLKKGDLNQGRHSTIHEILNHYTQPKYVQDIDTEIVQLLNLQNEDYFRPSSYSVHGQLGHSAITKILSTKRARWLNVNGAELKQHKPRPLHINWQADKQGNKKLQLSVSPTAKLLNTCPALYLDPETHQIGPIEGADFNEKQWDMILNIPPIPNDQCEQFSHQLLAAFPSTKLPTPKKIERIDIKAPLKPCLYIYSQPNLQGASQSTLRLRFKYDQYELNLKHSSPIATIQENAQSLHVFRDIDAEKRAIDTLTQLGFQTLYSEKKEECLLRAFNYKQLSAVDIWQQFLFETINQLEQAGWDIVKDDNFDLEFIEVNDWDIEIESDNEWFDLRFDLDIKGQKIPLLPLITNVIHHYDLDDLPEHITLPLPNSDNKQQYICIPTERIRPVFETLYELFDADALDEEGRLRLNRFDTPRLAHLEDSFSDEINWRGGDAMRQLGRKLKDFQGIDHIKPPQGLTATLRDYQQQGFNWLQFLRAYQFNGILADDMGLGKTVQTLTHLLQEKESGRMDKPCLILAPTSLMGNWRREAKQFTPELKLLILQGSERKQHFDKIKHYDLIISTYPLLVRDQDIFLDHQFHYFILDEAQVIKNPKAKAAQVARLIKTRHRLCLTGTPMENHLGELWALFDFLMPGCLGKQKDFNQNFRNPIEKQGQNEQQLLLNKRIKPFMLRRNKSEVIKELPEKTEIIRSVAFDKSQAALYESIRLSMEKKVRDAIKEKGLARSHIMILDALLKLRQTCCDPQLLPLAQAKKVKQSAKLDMLMEMLPEMIEEGRRILIFSQFTKMLGIIEKALKKSDISYTKLTGSTKKRDDVIERFCSGEVDVFLISLKAGGVGLNLTEADTVIHYDPWWNPAVENQATDRVHRIGQQKAVFVYKLIIENTLEEKIMAMQARKQALADAVYNADKKSSSGKLDATDLELLFAPLTPS